MGSRRKPNGIEQNESGTDKPPRALVPFSGAAIAALGQSRCVDCANASYEKYEGRTPAIERSFRDKGGHYEVTSIWPLDSVFETTSWMVDPTDDFYQPVADLITQAQSMSAEGITQSSLNASQHMQPIQVRWFRVYCTAQRAPAHRPAEKRTCYLREPLQTEREKNLEKEAERKGVSLSDLLVERNESSRDDYSWTREDF